MSPSPRALDGILVLDVGSFLAGPSAATVMSDFGAEVIKVETPDGGDPNRRLGELPGLPVSEHNYSWLLDSRNKKSLAVDLSKPEGREAFLRLAARADVLVTNFPPAVLARLRLTYEELKPLNPRLVYALVTGYGEVGEEANKPGFDINAWWARSGLMDLVHAPDGPPSHSMPGMGDHPTGMVLFGAVMLALYQREKTGRGAKVSTSLMASGAWANSTLIQASLCDAKFPERMPREGCRNPIINFYRCKDDRWFILTVLRAEKGWEPFTRAIERPELASDPRFATFESRQANAAELVAILDAVFASRDWAGWRERLKSYGVTFGPIARIEDVKDDQQMTAAEVIVPMAEGPFRTVSNPVFVAGQPKVPAGRAPELGEHTDEILRGLGYDAAGITELRRLRVIAP
ncbi:MAG TPA: CoA transferase [Methylomirabilota bacterium]|nr:CoA transferase [Methylomirabilota bacterium]